MNVGCSLAKFLVIDIVALLELRRLLVANMQSLLHFGAYGWGITHFRRFLSYIK